ncbi:MAG: L,D-transpeptidase [Phycisphaerae bacterium]
MRSAARLGLMAVVFLGGCGAESKRRGLGKSQPGAATSAIGTALSADERAIIERRNWNERVGARLGLWVRVGRQELVGVVAGRAVFRYRCSTALRGVGKCGGSRQTPLGWHVIAERIGAGLPSGAVLRDRQFSGAVWTPQASMTGDLVLSRVLWLRGVDPWENAGPGIGSHDRYIYIHGTGAEGRLGTAASAGCVRLSNRDVIALFEQVETGTMVLITAE